VKTLESAIIKCRSCGWEFGSDEAKVCWRCHSHICPKCRACRCNWAKEIFFRWPVVDLGTSFSIS